MPRKAKPKGSFTGKTFVGLIWDESGSMSSRQEEGIAAFNEQLKEMKESGTKTFLTFVLFGSQYAATHNCKTVYDNLPIDEVPELTGINYVPQGNTPLYDAMGITITEMAKLGGKEDRFLIVSFSDGFENASKEWNEDQLGKLIKDKTDEGNWTFVFAAAGIDAWAQAGNLNIPKANTLSVAGTGAGVKAFAATTSVSTRSYLSSPNLSEAGFYTGGPEGTSEGTREKETDKPKETSKS